MQNLPKGSGNPTTASSASRDDFSGSTPGSSFSDNVDGIDRSQERQRPIQYAHSYAPTSNYSSNQAFSNQRPYGFGMRGFNTVQQVHGGQPLESYHYWPAWSMINLQQRQLSARSTSNAQNQRNQFQPQVYEASWPGYPTQQVIIDGVQGAPVRPVDHGEPRWTSHEKQLLSSITGFFANQMPPGPNGRIEVDTLPWDYISAYIVPIPSLARDDQAVRRSAEACRTQWKKMFLNHFLVRVPSGVILCKALPESTEASVMPQEDVSGASSRSSYQNTTTTDEGGHDILSNIRKRPRKNWSEEEKVLINDLQNEHGNKWTLIASKLGTDRTPTEVKNYWHHNKHKIIGDRKRSKIESNPHGAESSKPPTLNVNSDGTDNAERHEVNNRKRSISDDEEQNEKKSNSS